MGSTYLFCSCRFHGTWRGIRGLYKARIMGGSRSESLGCQVSFQSTLGRSTYPPLADHQVHVFNAHQPFPANLMVGFYATTSESQELRVDLDNELIGKSDGSSLPHWLHFFTTLSSDARWFTREEIITVLNHPDGTNFNSASTSPGKDDPPFRVPSKTAIAGVLISDWAHGMSLDTHCASPRL